MRFFLPFILCFLLLLTSCSIINSGGDLNGFSGRLSKLYSDEGFSSDGYINDKEGSSFYRFFESGDDSLLLKLTYNTEYDLTSLTLTAKSGAQSNSEIRLFVKNAIKAFLETDETDDFYIEEVLNSLDEISPESKTTELRGAEIITDTATLGWVITVRLLDA